MFMFSNALGSEQGVILDRASECFFQSDEQTRAETTDLQQTESLWGSYCLVSCWVCARELLIQLYSLTDGCTKLHDIVQMLLFVSDSCIREKQSVPFPSTQPTCFPEPRVDFFSSSRPVLGADSEVIHTDGKTVTVTKPTVCPLSVWWDSEEISRDTWRIFLHFDKERTPRSTYREMKVTGGFFFCCSLTIQRENTYFALRLSWMWGWTSGWGGSFTTCDISNGNCSVGVICWGDAFWHCCRKN